MAVKKPLVSFGRPNLDFGQAFYLTDIRGQAEKWAETMCKRTSNATPILNVYDFDMEQAIKDGYKYRVFAKYDEDWLNFIVACRMGRKEWMDYDIIEGGIANDRVIDTVEAYMEGLTPIGMSLGLLAQHKPNNQIAITNQEVVDMYLTFKDCIKL